MKRLAVAVALALMATSAHATWVTCQPGVVDNLTPNIGCAQSNLYVNDPTNLPLVINSDGLLFGHTDWTFLKKDEDDTDTLDTTPPLEWNFGGLYPDGMAIVVKYGNYPITAYNVVVQSGFWTDTFAETFCKGAGVSHLSYYVRGTPTTVPEPTSLALMFAGLLGLAVTRRKTV